MISSLHIQGFKCFDDELFEIGPLTLVSGLNSSGKSTFLQAIRLIYGYGTPLAKLGPLEELTSKLHTEFSITLISHAGEYNFCHPESKNYDYPYVEPTQMSYISASRLGPELHLPICADGMRGQTIGERGEFVLDYLEYHSELAGLPKQLRRKEANSSAVHANISEWLGLISPGVRLKWEPIPKADLVRGEYNGHRPSNVGFGLSYTLPVIANILVDAALIANGIHDSTVILLENPEAHLHPAGQTQLGILIGRAVSCGVQIIVETHSDHLLNGIRIAVKEKILPAIDTSFYYFTYNFETEKSTVAQPVLDSLGYFDEWPDGFFDETEKNLERLL